MAMIMGQAVGQLAGTYATQVPQPRTIATALSHLEELNKQIAGLREKADSIATAIGGPRPVPASETADPRAQDPSVVAQLNDGVDFAQRQISWLSESVDAMSRSLGV